MIKKHRFGAADYQVESEHTLFRGFFQITKLMVRHRLFGGGWSETLSRELFQRGDAVGVLLYDPANNLVGLVEQFRVGALKDQHGPWQYEVVAGMIESGETPEQVAVRECQEEAGVSITTGQLHKICEYLVTPGGSNESLTIYCAPVDANEIGGFHGVPNEGEDIRVLSMARAELWHWLQEGKVTNAATIIALQWLELNFSQMQVIK